MSDSMIASVSFRISLIISALLIADTVRAVEPARTYSIAVPGSTITEIRVHNSRSVLVFSADQERGVGRLIECSLPARQARELYAWPKASSGIILGGALEDEVSVVPTTGAGLSLSNVITRLELSGKGATAKEPLTIGLDDRRLFDLFVVEDELVGIFGYPGTSRISVESLQARKSLIDLPEIPGNPATSVVEVSPDGRFLAIGVDKQITNETELQCWSLSERKLKWSVRRPDGGTVCALCFSGPNHVAMGTTRAIVEVFDVPSGKLLLTLPIDDSKDGMDDGIRRCVSTVNGSLLAVWHRDRVSLIDLVTRKRTELLTDTKHISGIALESDGQFVATGISDPNGCRIEIIELAK